MIIFLYNSGNLPSKVRKVIQEAKLSLYETISTGYVTDDRNVGSGSYYYNYDTLESSNNMDDYFVEFYENTNQGTTAGSGDGSGNERDDGGDAGDGSGSYKGDGSGSDTDNGSGSNIDKASGSDAGNGSESDTDNGSGSDAGNGSADFTDNGHHIDASASSAGNGSGDLTNDGLGNPPIDGSGDFTGDDDGGEGFDRQKRNAGHFKGVDKTVEHKKDRTKRQIPLNYEDYNYNYFQGKLIFTFNVSVISG